MSHRKWRVDRVHHVWPEPHHAWQVTEALARGLFDYHGPFPTHEEAIEYADRMARTVQVTLPKPDTPRHYLEGNWEDVEITIHPEAELVLIRTDDGESEGDSIAISSDQFEPLALALLAHHYRKAHP